MTVSLRPSELGEPNPVHRRCGRANSGTNPRDADTESARGDGAAHRGTEHESLTVDSDRNHRLVRVDGDIARDMLSQSVSMCTAEKPDGLTRTAHRDRHHAENSVVQPRPMSEADKIASSVRPIAHQHGLRSFDLEIAEVGDQSSTVVARDHVRQHLQDRSSFRVAIGGALHYLRIGTEGGVVDESSPVDGAEVDT